mmetsp:Transcript_27512/g.38092  ORF Transcript_27512/g.38092 Transcript_27512/m.38092 type:complete len:98 (-) Transcript_27512:14-307(-)
MARMTPKTASSAAGIEARMDYDWNIYETNDDYSPIFIMEIQPRVYAFVVYFVCPKKLRSKLGCSSIHTTKGLESEVLDGELCPHLKLTSKTTNVYQP